MSECNGVTAQPQQRASSEPEKKKKKKKTRHDWKRELLQVEERDGAEIIRINDTPFNSHARDRLKIKREDKCQYRAKCGSVEERKVRQIIEKIGMLSTEQVQLRGKQKMKATCVKRFGHEHAMQAQEVKEKAKATNRERRGCDYPSQCQEVRDKAKATCLVKYGYANPLQSQEVKEKAKATNRERRGCDHPTQCQEVRDKVKATCLVKYGCANPSQSQEIKDKKTKSSVEKYGCNNVFQAQEVKDKAKMTCLDKYGCANPSQSQEVKDKKNKSSIEKYGCNYVFQSREVKDTIKATNHERFGCDNPMQNAEVKEKAKATNHERFGCDHPMQNADFFAKMQKNSYSRKPYTFKDNTVVEVQGYEGLALRLLEDEHQYTSADFTHGKERLQQSFPYCDNGKDRVYYPDIPTPNKGRLQEGWIEVKSPWTFRYGMEKNREIIKKGRAVIDAGCYFSVWVFDSDRDLDPVRITSEHGADAFERACTQYYHSAFGFSLLPAV